MTFTKGKYTKEQKRWCSEYEKRTTFEPLMCDFEAGNESFEDAAKMSKEWFEHWASDALLGIPAIPSSSDA